METTLVTYYPVVSQQLWQENQRAIGNKPYADYFCKQLKVPVDLVHATQNGPLPPEKTFPPVPECLNSLFTELSHFPRAVYGVADDGEQGITTCNVTRHFMPGVTVAMMEWWFLWHVAEKERYSLWFPYAHVDNSVADPQRLNDPHLRYAEKLYGNPNHIIEYIGDTKLDAIIHFTDPVALGIDKALLERHNLRFSASGWATQADRPDIANTLMLHIGRDVAGGFELYSCYFIGIHQQFSRISGLPQPDVRATAEAAGMNRQTLEALSYEMAVHDMTEFTQLGRMLPQLYRQFAD
ncbi:DAPG hydrolase family protein [Erwinia mallotivora]|uniref:DAPG hydrolase family protein n=1 Tax=Erwinia mallotivora TaxID=69222 RepID=UPI0035EAE4F6